MDRIESKLLLWLAQQSIFGGDLNFGVDLDAPEDRDRLSAWFAEVTNLRGNRKEHHDG